MKKPMSPVTYSCRAATDEEASTTVAQLKAHTEVSLGVQMRYDPFGIFAYEGKTLIGSIIGKIYSNWMHMDLVWVDEKHRRRGIGSELIRKSVAEARQRRLTGIEVWSQSWQAPEFYMRNGFREYAVLEDFIPGKKRHVLHYMLAERKA